MKKALSIQNRNTIFFWLLFWVIQSLLMSGGEFISFYLMKNIAIVSLQALVVYINIKWLFPIFFEKRKYMAYIISCMLLIYLVFTLSFFFIDIALSLTAIPLNFSGIKFSKDFWIVLSGSSFYSLALVCSNIYKLLKINRQKELTTSQLLIEKKINETKYRNFQHKLNAQSNTITIREGNKTHLVLINDILYIKGLKEYVIWQTKSRKIITLESLSKIEEKYHKMGFIRIHKSYIINRNNTETITRTSVKINDEIIPVGRTYKASLQELLLN